MQTDPWQAPHDISQVHDIFSAQAGGTGGASGTRGFMLTLPGMPIPVNVIPGIPAIHRHGLTPTGVYEQVEIHPFYRYLQWAHSSNQTGDDALPHNSAPRSWVPEYPGQLFERGVDSLEQLLRGLQASPNPNAGSLIDEYGNRIPAP
jgi:hypothetical protein